MEEAVAGSKNAQADIRPFSEVQRINSTENEEYIAYSNSKDKEFDELTEERDTDGRLGIRDKAMTVKYDQLQCQSIEVNITDPLTSKSPIVLASEDSNLKIGSDSLALKREVTTKNRAKNNGSKSDGHRL